MERGTGLPVEARRGAVVRDQGEVEALVNVGQGQVAAGEVPGQHFTARGATLSLKTLDWALPLLCQQGHTCQHPSCQLATGRKHGTATHQMWRSPCRKSSVGAAVSMSAAPAAGKSGRQGAHA